jgi:hypothetical protein
LAAVVGTQAAATLISVYGAWLVTPLGWKYAGFVWGYAFVWFLVTDPVKLLAYEILDAAKADSAAKGIASAAPTPRAGQNGAEQVGAFVALIGGLTWPRSAPGPLAHQPVLLADAGLILT